MQSLRKAAQGLVQKSVFRASQHAVGTLERYIAAWASSMHWDSVTACANISCGITACGHAPNNLTHGVACAHAPQYGLDIAAVYRKACGHAPQYCLEKERLEIRYKT